MKFDRRGMLAGISALPLASVAAKARAVIARALLL